MVLFRLLPLVCMVATAFAKRPPLCPLPSSHGVNPSEIPDNCLCPSGSPTILDSLDPENAGLERLVIFTYRQPKTGTIFSFIPDFQYQRQIPDIAVEHGTIHEITDNNQCIVRIFENTPRKEIRTNRPYNNENIQPPRVTQLDSNDPNNVVIVVDANRPDGLNYVPGNQNRVNKKKNLPPWLVPLNKPFKNQYGPIHFKRQSHYGPVSNEPDKAQIPQIDIEMYEATEGPNNVPSNGKYPVSEKPWFANNPSIYNDYPIPSDSDIIDIVHKPSKGQHYSQNDEDDIPSESNTPDDLHPPRNPILDPFNPYAPHGTEWDYQTVNTWGNKYAHGFVSPQKVQVDPKLYYNAYGDNAVEQNGNIPGPFDYWLKKQLNFTGTDNIALHRALRNVLWQNGFIVSKRGILVDGKGVMSNLENLKLRPILIGKSISYDRFLKHIDTEMKFKIKNTPVLKGLLLTTVKPPKILGIVPFSMAFLPQKSGRKNKGVKNITPRRLRKWRAESTYKRLPIDVVTLTRQGVGLTGHKANQSSALKVTSIPYSKKPEKESGFHRKKVVHPQAEGEKPAKHKDISEEVPDFRIIGGSSATGSGTPILNRGRSGLDE